MILIMHNSFMANWLDMQQLAQDLSFVCMYMRKVFEVHLLGLRPHSCYLVLQPHQTPEYPCPVVLVLCTSQSLPVLIWHVHLTSIAGGSPADPVCQNTIWKMKIFTLLITEWLTCIIEEHWNKAGQGHSNAFCTLLWCTQQAPQLSQNHSTWNDHMYPFVGWWG